ncbi:sigma-70 family RNA polymerase sigma factor [Adhaeretor mobilis]|uniref:ECF RNA polymerase sigma factor SigH n=1 Tax=Adhaeretor mobilis TaxID=1930276 RepID=A0A517N1A5_9BACT|nr:sigma-70 family RNA polymerase sigma factor [Adhaeretor mobilis]QDT00798.1 ECF RNA polymerase sigma factor SigH [Adhaeretor mobilis]
MSAEFQNEPGGERGSNGSAHSAQSMPKQNTAEQDKHRDAFARLFAKHDRWLFAYLVTLLSSPADAEEVFQEISVVIWRNYERFELGTDFVKWASVIAHNQVRKFRRQGRRRGFQLSDATLDLMAQETTRRADLFEFRREALRHCIEQLPENDQQLVQLCYSDDGGNFKTVAESIGRPVNTVYKALNRIRRVLHECIDRKIAQEGLL